MIRHLREIAKNIAQVLIWIELQFSAGFYQSVIGGAGFSGIGTAKEKQVLFADRGEADGIFDEVVVYFDFGMFGVEEQFVPQTQSIVDGFSRLAFG